MYYTALIGYIWYECEEDEKNMETLLLLVDNSKIGEDVEDKNVVDLLMDDLEKKTLTILLFANIKSIEMEQKKHYRVY